MVVPCFLLLGILFFGGGKLFSSGYLWPIIAGVFVAGHIWTMFKGRGRRSVDSVDNEDGKTNVSREPETKDKHQYDDCCH